MAEMVYRIRDWTARYEVNRTRELKRMDWVPMPNRMDGDAYIELIDHPQGAAHYGAWLAVALIASRCDPRGLLLRADGTPHDPASLSRICRIPAKILKDALPRLVSIGWLEEIPHEAAIRARKSVLSKPQGGAEIPQVGATIPHHGAEIPQGDAVKPHPPAVSTAPARAVQSRAEESGVGGGSVEKHARRVSASSSETSQRFEEWWNLWSSTRGTNHRLPAMHAFGSVVTQELEADCFECTIGYVAAFNDPTKGYNPENFLFEQAKDQFKARWPRASPRKGKSDFVGDVAEVLGQKLARGEKPW